MRIGLLNGGGDCPGLNAVTHGVVGAATRLGWEVLGFRDGYEGLLSPGEYKVLRVEKTEGILKLGGTILGTSNRGHFAGKVGEGGVRQIPSEAMDDAFRTLRRLGVSALICVGGDGSLTTALQFHNEGFPVVGVPKTIDNDLGATAMTFGFDSAIQVVADSLDRLHTTAESHSRVMVLEVMGRHAGWIALHSGLAGGANVILIPERQFDVNEVCDLVGRRFASHFAPIVVVAEGAEPVGGVPARDDQQLDAFGHVRLGGIGHWLEGEIERITGKETRATVLGHVQRGGTPTAFDRVLATRFGLHAIDAVEAGRWGTMAALRGTEIKLVELTEATAELKTVPESLYAEAEVFFG